MSTQKPWEEEARNWVKWARTPDHDVFWFYSPSFFEEIVPSAHGLTLEIGCGEGRVARQLASRAHNVVALDSSSTLVQFAREADAQSAYVFADATALPFADATFQPVVAYNSLQTTAVMVGYGTSRSRGGPRPQTVWALLPLRRTPHDRRWPR